MTDKWQKTIVGFLLCILFAIWFVWVHNTSVKEQKKDDFLLYAYFSKTDGLNVGAPVRMSGIPVGHVFALDFGDNFLVKVTLSFDKKYELPIDSSVSIETDGILGGKHIELVPGADEELLSSGDDLAYTQDVLLLDELLNKLNTYMAHKNEQKGVENEEESD